VAIVQTKKGADYWLIRVLLQMDALRPLEKSVRICQATRRHAQQDNIRRSYRSKNIYFFSHQA
jgi:hypothetical protein